MTPRRRNFALIVAGVLILLTASFLPVFAADSTNAPEAQSVQANVFSQQFGFSNTQSSPQVQATEVPPQPSDEDRLKANMSIGNETCLQCHGQPNLNLPLENGEILSLYIPEDVYAHSVHGEQGYACVQCHTNVGNYPHPPFSAADSRDATLQLYQVCQRCHSSLYELTQDSVHAAAMEAGNRNAAICSDCHTAHAVRRLTDPETGELLPESRVWIPQTCAQCHYAIYQKYSTSVHGSALLGEGNPDVPTCIDCHGVHNIENPTTAAFRLKSPDICAKCHTDPTIMDKYGISTQVLDTYVADFHGTTVTLFEKQAPDQETDKPVCFDCHGVHDIKRVDDPVEGLRIKKIYWLAVRPVTPTQLPISQTPGYPITFHRRNATQWSIWLTSSINSSSQPCWGAWLSWSCLMPGKWLISFGRARKIKPQKALILDSLLLKRSKFLKKNMMRRLPRNQCQNL